MKNLAKILSNSEYFNPEKKLKIDLMVIKKPAITMMDDSLSAVDTDTEEQILKRLEEEARSATRITIAHRISTVKFSDLIVVMEDGEIIERGTHQELLELDGSYAQMNRLQLLSDEIENI